MKELEVTVELLKEVIEKDVSFNTALKKKSSADSTFKEIRHTVATLLGCVLRHQLLLQYTEQFGS
mgnify:CR=1 FL=1